MGAISSPVSLEPPTHDPCSLSLVEWRRLWQPRADSRTFRWKDLESWVTVRNSLLHLTLAFHMELWCNQEIKLGYVKTVRYGGLSVIATSIFYPKQLFSHLFLSLHFHSHQHIFFLSFIYSAKNYCGNNICAKNRKYFTVTRFKVVQMSNQPPYNLTSPAI